MREVLSPIAGTEAHLRFGQAVVEHREEFRNYVLAHAEPWHREHLGRLYGHWGEWNAAYFGARMLSPYILLNETVAPNVYGCCARISGFGGRSEIRLRPSLLMGTHPDVVGGAARLEGRFLFVADVLMHEMIHQWHQEITGVNEVSYHGHGPAFRDVCNQIGAILGLPPVRSMKKRGKDKELPSCAQWPHCVRPEDHYLGAFVPAMGDYVGDARRRLHEASDAYYDAHVHQEGKGSELLMQLLERMGDAAVWLGECKAKKRLKDAARAQRDTS